MAQSATSLMTAEEFYVWANRPENSGKRYELISGSPVEMPSPGKLHGATCALITRVLWSYLDRRGEGYICSNDSGLIVSRSPDTLRGPDLMLYLKHQAFSDITPGNAEDVPNLVVEVMSPSDTPTGAWRRVQQYQQLGVPMVWVVSPEDRAVQVCPIRELPRVLDESDELTGNGALPEFSCRVADFFTVPGSRKEASV